jgi:hypothetical protein
MRSTLIPVLWHRLTASLLLLAASAAMTLPAAAAEGHDAASLRATYAELTPKLQTNQFQRPLYLNSTESSGNLTGDIFAVVDYPFAAVNTAFNGTAHWCDMLILHHNPKYCRASTDNGRDKLSVSIGKKHDQPLADAYKVDFGFKSSASTPEYLDVVLRAADGPMGTSDYKILLEAVSVGDKRTFIHLTYSYSYGMAARIAMRAYLSTVGSGKVGFTRSGQDGISGDYIGGVRGVVERNTMRYYLAIDSYLSAINAPAGEQLDRRLQSWFSGTERYARQLHEIDRNEYMEMKRSEYKRQQTAM